MIQVLIGRESVKNRLQLSTGNKTEQVGPLGAVPQSVSKQHCLLTIDGKVMTITNRNIKNATYVNGIQVESSKVTQADVVELGYGHYVLNWSLVMNFIGKLQDPVSQEVDISGLESVWQSYKHQQDQLQRTQTMTNVLRGGLPILTIGGVALGFIINKDGKGTGAHMIVIYAVALILMVLLFVKSFMDARRIPKQKEELNKRMLHRYACPKCHYFFGFQPYDVIRTNLDACPKCKVKLKK
ncbi:MAG: FHA domain-containing protein [Prevotella sp.]|nr:FHA domain-containing protein [Prevotella sp.]MBQ9187324.1 FHA domain-containing protein [Prevotella sp.]